MKQSHAEVFVDHTALFRLLGDEAQAYGVTAETIRQQLVDVKQEQLMRGPYACFIVFRDKSMAAQPRGQKRWEVDR